MPSHPRISFDRLSALARRLPALVILGARQIGKSTLARLAFPDFELVDLENPLGVSHHSVAPLLDIFEGVFLVRRLAPYAANVRKCPMKSPKLYVRDTGLLHAQLVDPGAQGFFYRAHGGQEVDLLLRVRDALLPIEIKLDLPVPDLRGLEGCMRDLGLKRGYIVNLSAEPGQLRRDIWMGGLQHLLEALRLAPAAAATTTRR